MISDHLVRFGQALKPILASVSDALTPCPVAMDLPLAGQNSTTRLRALGSSIRRFTAAAEDISLLILPDKTCTNAQIAHVVKSMHSAALELAALMDITAKVAVTPKALRSDRTLNRITRDSLVSIAHWLADIVTMTARPEQILAAGYTESDGCTSVDLMLRLPAPDTLTELETWQPAYLAYRADYVQAALALRPLQMSSLSTRSGAASSAYKPPSRLCGIGGGLLIGLLLGDCSD